MRGPRLIASLACSLGLVVAASPASANRIEAGYQTTWGKAGVSLEEYWTDSATCGHQAANVDLSDTTPAKALILASRLSENMTASSDMITAIQVGAPEVQWNRAATIMQRELESCLAKRGYVKFKLTKGQAHHLKKLEIGSLERREYLYRLASDPAVLRAQALKET